MDFLCFYFPLFCIHWLMEEDIRRGATEDGMKKTRTETVCKMKSDGIPFSTMAQYTELSIEEIEQL